MAPSVQKIKNFYFVTGSDDAEVRRHAIELARELAPDDDPFGKEIIEPSSESVEHGLNAIDQTLQSLLTFPFLSQGKLVWLKGASFLKDSPAGRSEAIQEALEKLFYLLKSGLPKGICFLMSAPEPDKRRAFYKNLSALATTTLCDKPDFGFYATEDDLIAWVARRARERGIHLDEGAAIVLAARVGADSGQIESELAKLMTLVGEGATIDEARVRSLVPQTRLGAIFDLSNSIQKRNLALSLATLEQLLRQGESAIGILLAAIVPTVRNLLLVKSLLNKHRLKAPERAHFFTATLQKLPIEETSHLPRKKDGSINTYGLGVAAVNASRFQEQKLQEGFLACCKTHHQLLRNQGGEAMLLTQLVVRLVAA